MKKIFAIAAVAALTLGSSAFAQTSTEDSNPVSVNSAAEIYVPLVLTNNTGADLDYGYVNPQNMGASNGGGGGGLNVWNGTPGIEELYRQLEFKVEGQNGDAYKLTIAAGTDAAELTDDVPNGISGGMYTHSGGNNGGRVIRIEGFSPAPGANSGQEFYVISFTDKGGPAPRFTGLGIVGSPTGNLPGNVGGTHRVAASANGINVPVNMGLQNAKRGNYNGEVIFMAQYGS